MEGHFFSFPHLTHSRPLDFCSVYLFSSYLGGLLCEEPMEAIFKSLIIFRTAALRRSGKAHIIFDPLQPW